MVELKPKDSVSLTNGLTAKIVKELGRGGQGIVYLVEVDGQQMALKWQEAEVLVFAQHLTM